MSGNYKHNITKQYLQLYCSHYLPIDSNQIPTGEIAFIPEKMGSGHENSGLGHELFDFRSLKLLGELTYISCLIYTYDILYYLTMHITYRFIYLHACMYACACVLYKHTLIYLHVCIRRNAPFN